MFEYVSKPLREALPEGSEMIVTDVAAPFLMPFKTVFFVAMFIAMPVVLFQVWQFVAPGLYKREKRLAIPLMASSIVLFYTGIAFAYFIVFRVMFAFFASVTPDGVAMTPDISAYLSFVLGIFLAFGLAFEVPIATVMLIWSGLVSAEGAEAGAAVRLSRRVRRRHALDAARRLLADAAGNPDVPPLRRRIADGAPDVAGESCLRTAPSRSSA